MSGYLGQEIPERVSPYKTPDQRLIEAGAALALREKLDTDPCGVAAAFVTNAAANGWRIDFSQDGPQVHGYPDLVGRMWQDLASTDTAKQAYGELVASSLSIDLVGDGR